MIDRSAPRSEHPLHTLASHSSTRYFCKSLTLVPRKICDVSVGCRFANQGCTCDGPSPDSHRVDETCSHRRDVPNEGPFRTRLSETFWDIDLVRGFECRANLARPRHGKLLSGLPETAVKMLVPCPPRPVLIGSSFGLYTSDNCFPWLDKNFHPHFSRVRLILEYDCCQIRLGQLLVTCRPGLGGEEDLSRAAIQRTAEGRQCVHGRFRVHAVIILDAAMVAPLADKLFRNILCQEHSLPNSPYHRDVSTPQRLIRHILRFCMAGLWVGKDVAYTSATPTG